MELRELILRISYLRTRANLSARKLSMEIGKAENYIHLMESVSGTPKALAPSFETLMDTLVACQTTPEEFFYHDIAQYKEDMKLLQLLKYAPKERKALAIEMLKVK